jgi:type IV pilus assembly protein PilC
MPAYQYEIRTAAGQISNGIIEATSKLDATSRLQSQGGYLLSVTPMGGAASFMDRLRSFNVESGPNLKDVRNFTNQLSVMIKAGINIRSAIEGASDQIENGKFRKILEEIRSDVEAGEPFSDALAKHPKVFSPLYINMVKASELSGNFGNMLERICEYLTQQVETRSMVRGAMVYPTILGVMAVVTTLVMLTWVLPRFTALFVGKEDLLPGPTKALMALSDFFRNYWYVAVGTVAALGGAFIYFTRTPVGKVYWDKCKLRIPLFSKMFRALYITRGLQTMGELINAGVPMLETIEITADISGNSLFQDMWQNVHESVRQGSKISQPLGEQSLMPRNVVYMIDAGEQSGKLGAVLRDVADFYSKELRSTIKAVTSMIEPIMIVLMGGVVGFIAMSIILPVFKMSSLAK